MNETIRSTAEWQSTDVANYLHPFTNHLALATGKALILARGSGCYVWDTDGNRFLDGFAGLACVALGYGRRELGLAAARQIEELSYSSSFFKYTNKPAIALAEKLVRLTPEGLNHVFFANSGSEANDTAIRMVRQYWRIEGQPARQVIIGREAAYHGSTVAAGALSGMPTMHEQGAHLPDVVHIKAPYQFAYGRGIDELQFARIAAAWLEEKILDVGPERVAAFFAEPIQGAGGFKMPPRGYFREIQRICRKYGVLLVVDEVITGFGRTGRWFASELYEITDIDLMCIAKGITSGYVPLSAVMVGDRIASALIDKGGLFAHGFTSSGHPVSCAVALENIRILEDENIVDRVAHDIGPYFHEQMGKLSDHEIVGEVRSVGLMGALELVSNPATLEPIDNADEVCEKVRDLGLARGIIVRPVSSTVTIAPPLVITRAEIDFLFEQLRATLDEFAGFLSATSKA
jgi:putrescine---pyruvate transaminase